MKIGLFASLANPFMDTDYVLSLATNAERLGFSSIWVGEHTVLFDNPSSKYPYNSSGSLPRLDGSGVLEPFVALSFIAAATSHITLGTGICILPQRNPVYVAKSSSSLDWLSGGRFCLGVGVGWLREEFDALNEPWPARGARTDEYLKVMQSLWTEDPSSYDGQFFQLPPCHHFPKPVNGQMPVFIGGESNAALQRVARAGTGWLGFFLEPAEVEERLNFLNECLSRVNRDTSSVEIAVRPSVSNLDQEMINRYQDAGVDQVILPIAQPTKELMLEDLVQLSSLIEKKDD